MWFVSAWCGEGLELTCERIVWTSHAMIVCMMNGWVTYASGVLWIHFLVASCAVLQWRDGCPSRGVGVLQSQIALYSLGAITDQVFSSEP